MDNLPVLSVFQVLKISRNFLDPESLLTSSKRVMKRLICEVGRNHDHPTEIDDLLILEEWIRIHHDSCEMIVP